jgi:cysteinyl-tRNA synthetase
MVLRITNTLTNRKEVFEPLEPGHVRMYACGVTVYDLCHLGHGMQAMIYDVIRNYFQFCGWKVTYIRNYTDVDDKIIKRANELGISPLTLSARMIEESQKDLALFNIAPADIEPKVSDHIADIIAFIEMLIANGSAYEVDGDVYYRVRNFPAYGKLSNRNIEELESSGRIDPGEKKQDLLDFALWKKAKEGEVAWPSPWGEGRPGWHIECSAMSIKYLGTTFDIHGGGRDLVFPHHENEIAQSEAATGKPFARYWIHNGLVTVDNQKMSKSLGNFILLRDIVKEHHPEAVRSIVFSNHYSSNVDFSPKGFQIAYKRLDYFYTTLYNIDEFIKKNPPIDENILDPAMVSGIEAKFREAMDDDLNTALALAHFSEVFKYANELITAKKPKPNQRAYTLHLLQREIRRVAKVLGFFGEDPALFLNTLKEIMIAKQGIDQAEVEREIERRNQARAEKNYQLADTIRDQLKSRGISLLDTVGGTQWKVDIP